MDGNKNLREQHRLFVESMERFMGSQSEGDGDQQPQPQPQPEITGEGASAPPAESETSGGAVAAASTSPNNASASNSSSGAGSPSTAAWRRMAADLGWSMDEVQVHAYLYYAALCEDRRHRKRHRRMARESRTVVQRQDEHHTREQEPSRTNVGDMTPSDAGGGNRDDEPTAGEAPPSPPKHESAKQPAKTEHRTRDDMASRSVEELQRIRLLHQNAVELALSKIK